MRVLRSASCGCTHPPLLRWPMISRRSSLHLTARAVTALLAFGRLLSGRAVAAQAALVGPASLPRSSSGLHWDTILHELQALTRTQYAPDWNEAAHVEAVASLLGAVDVTDPALQRLLDRYQSTRRDFPAIRTVHDGGDFSVTVLQFQAGESIELHNHPRMTGVILCITGSVTIEAFTLLDGTTPEGHLRIQHEGDVVLGPGDHATLVSGRGNIHALQATEWCELIDVFTPPYTPDRADAYRRYARSATPVEGTDIYAAWELGED